MRSLIPWRRRDLETGADRTFSDFRREFDDLMHTFFDEHGTAAERYFGLRFTPAFDISETEDEITVKAELPGVDAKDVDVSLSGNVLTVRGEKKEEKEEKGENMHRIERSFGAFCRSFTLPCDVQNDKVEATFKDGVLNLKLPKAETAKAKAIKVEVK